MPRFLKILLLILSPCAFMHAQTSTSSYAPASILASGKWFRMAVTEDGIYRIDYSRLKQIGLTNPDNPVIYGNNQGQLSYYNSDPHPDDLNEIPIHIETGTDGIFNEGDYLLFYGKGTNKWVFDLTTSQYNFLRHNYSDTAVYFLSSRVSQGKRILPAIEPSVQPNYFSSVSDALYIHEKEVVNLIKSGREWFQQVSATTGIALNPGFSNIITSDEIKYRIRVLDRSSVPTLFRFYEGQTLHGSIPVQAVNLYNSTGTYAQIGYLSGSLFSSSNSPVFEIRYYNNGEAGEHGWLDYVMLQARRQSIISDKTLHISDYKSIASAGITEFTFTGPDTRTIIWDVTDPNKTKRINYSRTGDRIKFKAKTDSLRTYLAFIPGNALTPLINTHAIPNQNLHSSVPSDMLIVTHPLFRAHSVKLADIHNKNSGLISQIVTPEEIYNEFSGGIRDIVAIRNFIRMKYLKQKGTNHPLKYLLLFGDGSYENKTLPPDNPNFIPTWQSQNSNILVSSFTSDDFYGLLEDGEGESEGTEDIGIGRLPVSDTLQAGIIVSKIARYISPLNRGNWKNVITMVADDEDGNSHISDAEGLSSILRDSVPSFNVNKIYLDAYKQVTSSNGQSYPDVNKAINNRINSGCLIFNYIGHGSETGLAQERVIKTEDINSWINIDKLPLFITATCEFSRFDDVDLNVATRYFTSRTSAGEMVLLSNKGGAIALMSTTRLVYSAPNYFLNKNIYDYAFDRDENGNALRLGDIIRLAKNSSGNGSNKRNFSLLGDPALRLAYPWHGNVVTDSINHIFINNSIDTLKALSLVNVSGHVEDIHGNLAESFSGEISPLIYDKENKIRTLANDGGPTMEFKLINNILYSGNTLADKGRFNFTFIVPRDINYSFGTGKISYYASDNESDMNGSFNKVIVGGFANTQLQDTTGPEILLYLNDTLFRNGGLTDARPVLIAIIKDEAGINTTGSGIGHDLTGKLDNESFVLNNYYENDFNTYKSGRIIYNLNDLTKGNHSISVKAWDNYNNSSEKSVAFLVKSGQNFILNKLINYPNPFSGDTRITAEHNRPDEELDITIYIYNIRGQVIKIIKNRVISYGYVIPPILWDGNDDGGKRVGRGIYPYKVMVRTVKSETAGVTGRMIIL